MEPMLFLPAILGLAVYFIPSIVAKHRGHPQLLAIFMLNLFLGWSIFGWAAALVWAVLSQPIAKSEATN